ncbi:MAG: DUF5050 domain-containing protein [Clostridia bacterium]|jgi:hypothetical protein
MAKSKFKLNLRNRQHRTAIISGSIAIILIASAIILFNLFNKSYNDFEGNSPSNIVNNGLAAYEDGSLYYTKFDAGYKIFKFDIKSGNEKAVYPANAKYINVLSGYIYYIDSSNGNIKRITVSGAEELILKDSICSHLYVTKDWIYYIDNKENNSIHRINMYDFSEELLSEENAASLFVNEDFIYFINYMDNNGIYRLNLDTKEVSAVLKQHTIFYTIKNNRIYYTNTNDESYIYSMNLDGSENKRLEGVKGWFISSSSKDSDHLYFKSTTGSLKRVNLTTLNQTTMANEDCAYINILNDYVVYLNQDDNLYYILDMLSGKSRILK